MATLSRHCFNVCARRKLRSTALALWAVGGVLLAAGVNVEAAPITFQFETALDNVVTRGTSLLPSPPKIGDLVTGIFTFEPENVIPNDGTFGFDSVEIHRSIQQFPATFSVGTLMLSASWYEINTRDNGTADDSPAISDLIHVGCTSCLSATGDGASKLGTASMSLILLGPGDVFDGSDIPTDPATWNRLAPGRISFSLTDLEGNETIQLYGPIHSVELVPEPNSICLLFMSAILAASCGASRYLRRFYDVWYDHFGHTLTLLNVNVA